MQNFKKEYLVRIEYKEGYYNIIPVLKRWNETEFIEFDVREEFGIHRNINIKDAKYYNGESSLIQDNIYVLLNLDEEGILEEKETPEGELIYKIKSTDYIQNATTLEDANIVEVVEIAPKYNLEKFESWKDDLNEELKSYEERISSSVYLKSNGYILGEFKCEERGVKNYYFKPKLNNDSMLKLYKFSEYAEDRNYIKTFDFYDYYNGIRVKRTIILRRELDDKPVTLIDCISEANLKALINKILIVNIRDKEELERAKEVFLNLPNIDAQINENRKQKIINMLEKSIIANEILDKIANYIMENYEKDANIEKNLNSVLSKIGRNDKFSANISVVEKEPIQNENIILDEDYNNELENKLKDANKEIVALKKQILDIQSKNKKLSIVEESIDLRKKEKKILENELKDIEDRKQEILKDIKDAIDDNLSKVAFNGTLANLFLQEASKYERISKNNLNLDYSEVESRTYSPKELINFLYDELRNKAYRNFEIDDIANFIICITQGFLTILAGEPGSGKTSLVALTSKILGLDNEEYTRYSEVAVEKGWTSRRDFIGYYNPLTKTFEASNKGMITALETLKTEKEEDILEYPYFVLLDEANLSQMEYYWADFMSLCDFTKPKREVSLGDDYVYPITDALRFIATINLDQTTETLSPRLIDRAWIIMIRNQTMDIESLHDINLDDFYPLVDFNTFKNILELSKKQVLKKEILIKFKEIQDIFKNIGINFSPRTLLMIKDYCLLGSELMAGLYKPLDYAVAQKILPVINGYGDEYKEFLEQLLDICNKNIMPISNKLIEEIIDKGDRNMGYYQFFTR